jgi:hypothetical protein
VIVVAQAAGRASLHTASLYGHTVLPGAAACRPGPGPFGRLSVSEPANGLRPNSGARQPSRLRRFELLPQSIRDELSGTRIKSCSLTTDGRHSSLSRSVDLARGLSRRSRPIAVTWTLRPEEEVPPRSIDVEGVGDHVAGGDKANLVGNASVAVVIRPGVTRK